MNEVYDLPQDHSVSQLQQPLKNNNGIGKVREDCDGLELCIK